MDGLIAEKGKTKLIFFAVDDETLLPTKKEIRDYFPDCSYNIYKEWGHFRYELQEIESIFRIKNAGIDSTRSYYSQDKIFTHIYRINTDQSPNLLFILKYGALLRGFYQISRENLSEIKTLNDFARKQSDIMKSMSGYIQDFENGKKLAQLFNVNDKTMSSPDSDSINKLFANYGESAAQQLLEKINQFIEKIKWR